MLSFLVKRLALAVLVALTVSAVSFSLLFMAGDPAVALAGENATPTDIARIREIQGFDRPLVVQYLDWLFRALQGDLGRSWYFHLPVAELIGDRMSTTMTLGATSILFALALALPMGVAAAVWQNSIIDRAALLIAVVGQAIPSFWFALMLIVVFAVNLGILPSSGADSWQSFVLPTVVLGYYATPAIMRLTRAGMLEVLSADYIRTARAKGLSSVKVVFKHSLRNAVIPVISLAAVQLGFMLGGSIVVESIFALHGAGYLAWESISRNDLPTMQALILIFAMFYIFFTLLADLLNAWMDPRLRLR
jgi:peptide/nickel transport system permease protein